MDIVEGVVKEPIFTGFSIKITEGRMNDGDVIVEKDDTAKGILVVTLMKDAAVWEKVRRWTLLYLTSVVKHLGFS